MKSYGKFGSIEIRDVSYLPGFEPKDKKIEFDVVKWEPQYDTQYCFSIARLIWDDKEQAFEMQSVGLRFLEHTTPVVNAWLIQWCKLKEIEIKAAEDADNN